MNLNIINKKITSLLFAALMITSVFAAFMMPVAAAGRVDLSIQPPVRSVGVGETFTLEIRAAAGAQPVSGISAFLDFNPRYLEVVSIERGVTLPTELPSGFNNTIGTIDYSAGDLIAPHPTGTFTVATITFRAIRAIPAGTAITFNRAVPRQTMAEIGGVDITGSTTGATVTVAADVLPVPPRPGPIPPTSLILRPDPHTMYVNNSTVFIVYSVLPIGASKDANFFVRSEDGRGAGTIRQINSTAAWFNATSPGRVLVYARSVLDWNDTGTALVTIRALPLPEPPRPERIFIRPETYRVPLILCDQETKEFRAYILPKEANQTVTWSVTNMTGKGTINATTGLFRAISEGTVNITATSVAYRNLTKTIHIAVVISPMRVVVHPAVPRVNETETIQFFATKAPIDVIPSVFWYVNNVTGTGTICRTTGLFRAISPGYVTVFAYSVVYEHIWGETTVRILPAQARPPGNAVSGDVDGDRDVDIHDFTTLQASFGKRIGVPGFNPRANFDGDEDVDIHDFTILQLNFGR